MTAPLLLATEVTKTYGSSRALDGAELAIGHGAIHGLLGKNGAGKSTLARAVAGLVRPESGRIVFANRDLTHDSPATRRRLGIRLLDQHTEVLPDLSVTENLLLGALPRRRGLVDWRTAHESAAALLAEHGLPLDPRGGAGLLTLSQRRRLSIVKALAGEGRLVVLDEPTTGLTIGERTDLMRWVRRLAEAGRTFVYISHHNDEVRQLCTEYTVLRDGRTVARGTSAAQLTAAQLSKAVTGSAVREFHRDRRRGGADLLSLRGLTAAGVGPVDLTVRAGEIVALVGLPGHGPQELLRALAGLSGAVRGQVRVAGQPVSCRDPRTSGTAGLAYLTHDRMAEGVAAHLSVADNLHLGRWPRGRGRLVDTRGMARRSEQVRRELAVAQAGPWQEVGRLSGGNQQKVLLGRLLTREPRVLLLDEPTLGIDVAAKEAIHRLIDRVTGEGMAVLVRAYDPDETARLADRAVLFTQGRVTGELTGEALTVSAIATAQHVGGRP